MKFLKQSKHKKEPDLKKNKLKFKKGKRSKGKLKVKKEKLTFKQRIRKLPAWIKTILVIIVTPIVIVLDLLLRLIKSLPKTIKPTLKYIANNFISILILIFLIFTVHTGYKLLNNTTSKIDQLEDQITTDKELDTQKQTELDEYNKKIEERLNELQKQTEEQQNQTKELREKLNKVSVTSRGSTTPRQSANTQTTTKVTGSKAEYQAYAKQLCNNYGWSENDFQCLVKLWNRESGWNPAARNKSSGAFGIPQSLPASKIASEGNINDPQAQIRWGLKYIKNRYGNPSNAWSHSQQKGWY